MLRPAPTRSTAVVEANVSASKSETFKLPPFAFTVIKAFEPMVESPEIEQRLSFSDAGSESG